MDVKCRRGQRQADEPFAGIPLLVVQLWWMAWMAWRDGVAPMATGCWKAAGYLPVIVYDLLVFDRAQEINRRWHSIITHRLEV
jgi:hypothetical protein